jgi:hypothetical protein
MKDDFSVSQKLQAKFGGNYFLMEQIFYLETGGQIWQGINLLLEDGRSFTWKLEAGGELTS